MTLYDETYRIESTRLSGWDYTQAGYYFVTICCKNRENFFGAIRDGLMHDSALAQIIAEEWQKTPEIRQHVRLDEWIIMPNHVHGILIFTESVETPRRGVSFLKHRMPSPGDETPQAGKTPHRGVSTGLQTNSLGAVIGQFKSVCTKRIWKAGYTHFGWQTRFYDRILRDEDALFKARQYIRTNPLRWEIDQNNPANLYM